MFLPDFSGYTKDNWQDKFDRRLIQVIRVNMVDKRQVVVKGGKVEPISPAAYGEPKAQFENTRPLLEATPSVSAYGLQGYRPRGSTSHVTWTGTRPNGEFFFFRSTLAPGDAPKAGIPNPLCDVRYYSEIEDLFIVYRYSNDNLPIWREIDDAVWTKLHAWRVK
jgi:hypothetical protein